MAAPYPQADMLRIVMKNMGLTRNRLAEKLGVKRRALDTWLLPVGSKEHRKAPDAVLTSVWGDYLLFVRTVRSPGGVTSHQAVIMESPQPVRYETEHWTITFPTLFRDIREVCEPALEKEVIVGCSPSGKPMPPEYTLLPTPEEAAASIANPCMEFGPITCLDRPEDHGWVVIRHHESIGEASGYISAVLDMADDAYPSVGAFHCGGEYFTVLTREPRPGRPDRLVIYEAYRPIPQTIALLDQEVAEAQCWTKVIGPDGKEWPAETLHE